MRNPLSDCRHQCGGLINKLLMQKVKENHTDWCWW